ncbi:unnamed protein product [Polarella glacialis]|uniref:Uncharacterized protein n=1 Tax=Polarella glacialis TaxID=89957 RepID=A0A813HIZ4_POLGL|nr:unnamed protein product [Polarella glacialis]
MPSWPPAMVLSKAKAAAVAAGQACTSQLSKPLSDKVEDQLVIEFRKGLQRKSAGLQKKPASSTGKLQAKVDSLDKKACADKNSLKTLYFCARRFQKLAMGCKGFALDVLGVFGKKELDRTCAETCLSMSIEAWSY